MSISSVVGSGMQSVESTIANILSESDGSTTGPAKKLGGMASGGYVAYQDFMRFRTWKPATPPPAPVPRGVSGGASATAPMSFGRGLTEYAHNIRTAQGFKGTLLAGIKGIPHLAKSLLPAAKTSFIFSAAIAGATNLFDLVKGNVTLKQAAGNFAADTAVGTVGGVAGAVAAGAVSVLLGGLLGPIAPIVAAVAGAAGFMGVDYFARSSGIRDSLASTVTGLMGG